MDKPVSFEIQLPGGIPSRYDNHITRRLSSMKGQFQDPAAYENKLAVDGDVLLYEVYEHRRPELEGELLYGISIVHPGRIEDEYNMTKGHFHTILETGEAYHQEPASQTHG